jgi:nucleoside-diphosphate-sugar epimerase
MKVLVTGGAGYMGSTLARILLEDGHQVRALDSLMYGGEALLGLYLYDGFEFIQGDVRSAETMESVLEGVDAVVHLAAIVGDPACAREPDISREVNQNSSIELYRRCQDRGIQRFVFASTCSNYGKMVDSSDYVTETSELQPISLYAETKVAVENFILDSADTEGTCATILRFATLFGLSAGNRVKIKHVEKSEDPRDYRVSFDKIKRELGFQITRTVSDGVDEIVDAIEKKVVTDFDNAKYVN